MRALFATLALLIIGCATQSPVSSETARAQFTHVLDQYIAAHPRHPYPAKKEQLAAFAAAHSMPLDLSWITGWNRMDRVTLMVSYKSKSGGDEYMVLSTEPI
jgi:hypothetical protein